MKTECLEAFETKCSWLESTTQISSFDEIYNKMLELCETDCCYSVKTLRNKLKEKYSKPVYFVEEQTEESVVIAAASYTGIVQHVVDTMERIQPLLL